MHSLNPYSPPESNLQIDSLDTTTNSTNPAKLLLLLFGWFYAAFSPITFLAGLQAGIHIMAASAIIFALACGTIRLANSPFTPLIRLMTIFYGICLVAFFASAILYAHYSSQHPAIVFLAFELLFAAPIPILALRHSPRQIPDPTT